MYNKIKHDENLNLDGTGLIGYVEITHKDLVDLFEEPCEGDKYKIDAEWLLKTPYGNVSIYNYKDGKNYCGENGTNVENITNWHVGGSNEDSYKFIIEYISKNLKK